MQCICAQLDKHSRLFDTLNQEQTRAKSHSDDLGSKLAQITADQDDHSRRLAHEWMIQVSTAANHHSPGDSRRSSSSAWTSSRNRVSP